jgi:DNA (cytosine-5)-methyltransferase 1
MVALDFFCGAGGLTRGFLNAGIEVRVGIDVDESCKRTYEANNAPAQFLTADIRKLKASDLSKALKGVKREELVFMGCAPCQPFSKQRREVNREGGTLLNSFGRLVAEFLPAYVIIENVPGVAKVPGNSTYCRLLKRLRSIGYRVQDGKLNAKHFGVPQTRCRWVVIASRRVDPQLPQHTHGPGLREIITVRNAIAGYPPLDAGEQSIVIPNHRAALLSERNLLRLRNTPRDGGGRGDWPTPLVLKCHRGKYKGHSDVYGRMRWDLPAPTLTCRCFSISNGRFGHPEQHRAISLREAARLQSFDDSYTFYGSSQASIGAQIGNAVPVRMAEALAEKVIQLERSVCSTRRESVRHL